MNQCLIFNVTFNVKDSLGILQIIQIPQGSKELFPSCHFHFKQ